MSELDLIAALSPRSEYEEFVKLGFRKPPKADLKALARAFADLKKAGKIKHAATAAGSLAAIKGSPWSVAGAGALIAAGANVAANIRGKDGKTGQQRMFERLHRHAVADLEGAKADGRKPGFMAKSKAVTYKPLAELSRIAADHPVQSTLWSAAYGAGIGFGIAKMVK